MRMGGFREWPVMEDYESARCLRRRGRIRISRPPVATPAARRRRLGAARVTLVNQAVIAGSHLGVPPATLSRRYSRNG